tara:strand:- start:76 stop:924 length:849 start_codon:yes stop_codon:yes gene_type:complete
MNIIKILLVLGLGYVATTQKVEKTRNILLIVTGLLAFCMFSVEGFTGITFGTEAAAVDGTIVTIPQTGNTITGADGIVYTFTPGNFDINTGLPSYDCPTNNQVKVDNRSTVGISAPLTGENINDIFSCSDRQKCKNASDLSCVYGYTLKSGDDDLCVGSACSQSDFEKDGSCCKPEFCECLTKTDGEHINCNSGWVSIDVGKYIKKNSESNGWDLTSKYWDEDNYKCWPMDLEELHPRLGIFSGKCVVPVNTPLEELAKCEPPQPDDDTSDNQEGDPGDGNP